MGLHTHSVFCDGSDTIEALCTAAFEKGLQAIGFSSHAPLPQGVVPATAADWHLQGARFEEYLAAVDVQRKKWAGRLQVFAALEIDYLHGRWGPKQAQYEGLDYCIASVHYLIPPNGEAPFTVDGSRAELDEGIKKGFAGDREAALDAYWDAVCAMVGEGGFDIVGHLDLIKKNNCIHSEPWFSPESPRYLSHVRRTVSAIARSGAVVEVNTGGLNRGRTLDTYPSVAILKELRSADVPVIITSDAHSADHLGGHYPEACAALLEAGYTDTVYFEGKGRWVREEVGA